MKEANRTQITETMCKQAQLMRKGGANQTEIGKLLGVNPCTISRIEKAGFDLETYQANRRLEKLKEKEKAPKIMITAKAEDVKAVMGAEELPGQMQMDLTPEKPEMIDQTKLMRFWAGQADKIAKVITDEMAQAIIEIQNSAVMLNTKLDRLNDTLCMILRAVRKE